MTKNNFYLVVAQLLYLKLLNYSTSYFLKEIKNVIIVLNKENN